LELGGIPLVTVLSQLTGIRALFVRKKAKEYGTCRLAEGGAVRGLRLVVIEDVVTSGGQIIDSVRSLGIRERLSKPLSASLIRQAGASENLKKYGIDLKTLLTFDDLRNGIGSHNNR
jgi:orotate phosphoribosyltransferase